MKVVGIDPGLDGGVAMWDGEDLYLAGIPTVKSAGRGRAVVWGALARTFLDGEYAWADHVFLEQVAARPGQGVSSMFKFGTVYGGIQGIVATCQLPITIVTPRKWMHAMGVGKGDKDASILRATELFPDHAASFRGPRGGKKDGVAEAALIARYGFNTLNNRNEP